MPSQDVLTPSNMSSSKLFPQDTATPDFSGTFTRITFVFHTSRSVIFRGDATRHVNSRLLVTFTPVPSTVVTFRPVTYKTVTFRTVTYWPVNYGTHVNYIPLTSFHFNTRHHQTYSLSYACYILSSYLWNCHLLSSKYQSWHLRSNELSPSGLSFKSDTSKPFTSWRLNSSSSDLPYSELTTPNFSVSNWSLPKRSNSDFQNITFQTCYLKTSQFQTCPLQSCHSDYSPLSFLNQWFLDAPSKPFTFRLVIFKPFTFRSVIASFISFRSVNSKPFTLWIHTLRSILGQTWVEVAR